MTQPPRPVQKLVIMALLVSVALPVAASEEVTAERPNRRRLRLDGRALYERAITDQVELSDGGAVELQQGVLIEDDGPAAGYSYRPNEEALDQRQWIKKELLIDRPQAARATLLVGRSAGRNPQPLSAVINGQQATLEPAGKAGQYWEQYRFDTALLRAGRNDFVLHGAGKVWIARDDEFAAGSRTRTRHPNRSAKSSDAGATWDYDHLGPKGDLDGEYYVRLFLDQRQPRGTLTLPVIDVANLERRPIGPPATKNIAAVHVSLAAETPAGAGVGIEYRTGASPLEGAGDWSAWRELPPEGGPILEPRGRYLQLKVVLASRDGLATPRLKSLEVSADASAVSPDWTQSVRQIEADNPPVVRSSIPFEYEPFDRPELTMLREKFALDKVTQDASTEFELIAALARWSSGLWSKGHLSQIYPEWNALKILATHDDGQFVGGFCQQYNLVFLQACESYGLVGRAVSLGQGESRQRVAGSGHEVVEIWSNEFDKWVYVDGNCGWYLVDEASGTPLSLWELRERQLAELQGRASPPVQLVRVAETKFAWESLTNWPPFVELRLIPRSNFLAEKSPLPLNQGMRGWFWTGHHVWSDEAVPAALIYSNRVVKRDNMEWTLNRAQIMLAAGPAAGELRVHLDTVTPGLTGFVATIDEGAPRSVQSGFAWRLHRGRNRLEVRPVNQRGRPGAASSVVLDASQL